MRFARKEKISDKELCEAVESLEKGLIDAGILSEVECNE